MAGIDRLDVALEIYTERFMRNVHTNIRGRVVGVNLSGPRVDVQPMASTIYPDSGIEDKFPVIFDVPLYLPSGNGGKARLSMPVKPGDIVGLSFSERNENDNSDLNTHQLFAGWAVTEIFAEGNAKPIHPDNVVLENDKIKQEMTPDGTMTITTPKGTLIVDKSGTFSFKNTAGNLQVLDDGTYTFGNGVATVNVTPGGQIQLGNPNGGLTLFANGESKFNGGTITKEGDFITAKGVSLDDFWADYNAHRHPGVQTGNGITGTKV